jgi:phenylacetate-CoA ligase
MSVIEQSFHRGLYLTLQWLRGRPVGPFMDQLRAWERLDRAEFEGIGGLLLQRALHYAHGRVPLYSIGRWRDCLGRADPLQLQSWPILDRHTVRTHGAQLRARGFHPGTFYRNSSASTGEPLRIAWNPHGAAWGWANEYRALAWHGIEPGVRTLLMWGWGHPLQNWVRNCKVFPTRELSPVQLEEAARFLLQQRPGMCMGLPSAFTLLARYVKAKYPRAARPLVPFVKLGGEQVYPFQREVLQESFGARLMETYGCTEVGPIASECPSGSMHIMAHNVHVEICRDGEPVAPGELGDIVVTSLSNRAMPLVRCKIGDSGRISNEPCACGRPHPVLSSLVGRAADLFVAADGSKVHGSALGLGLQTLLANAKPGAIRQVLFQQVDQRRWKILVESGSGFDTSYAARLKELVRATFGKECQAEIERVAVVPREASGKFRYYRPAAPSAAGRPAVVPPAAEIGEATDGGLAVRE